MTFNTNQIVLECFSLDDFIYTMLASEPITVADIGKCVSLDPAVASGVRLAGDGDPIYGRIYQVEDRSQENITTVTVETKFRKRVKLLAGEAPTIGNSIVGAGDGFVKAAPTANGSVILDVSSDYVIVEK